MVIRSLVFARLRRCRRVGLRGWLAYLGRVPTVAGWPSLREEVCSARSRLERPLWQDQCAWQGYPPRSTHHPVPLPTYHPGTPPPLHPPTVQPVLDGTTPCTLYNGRYVRLRLLVGCLASQACIILDGIALLQEQPCKNSLASGTAL